MDYTAGFIIGGIIIGAFIGFITGIFGVGGGFMLTPLLMICLGASAQSAVGTGLAAILANSAYGLYKRRGTNTIDVKLSAIISIGSIIGVLVGVRLLELLSRAPNITILGKEHQPASYFLLVFFLLLLTWIAAYLFYDYKRHNGQAPHTRVGYFAKFHIPPMVHLSSLEQSMLSAPVLAVFGFSVGLLTGLLGVGGGVVLLPALVYLIGQRAVRAAGTSLLLVLIASLTGVIRMIGDGSISFRLLSVLIVGGAIGTIFGTKIGLSLKGPKIRLYFVYVVAAAVLLVIYELVRITFFNL